MLRLSLVAFAVAATIGAPVQTASTIASADGTFDVGESRKILSKNSTKIAHDNIKDPVQRGRALVNGGDAVSQDKWTDDYPWLVRLMWKDDVFDASTCSGTLIDREWILTSAHCLMKRDSNDDTIRNALPAHFPHSLPALSRSPFHSVSCRPVTTLRESNSAFDRSTWYFYRSRDCGRDTNLGICADILATAINQADGNAARTIEASDTYIHPKYKSDGNFDMMLLKLDKPMYAAKPIPLSSSTPVAGADDAWVAGWGNNGGTSHKLHDGEITITRRSANVITSSYQASDGVATCFGDSGGPWFRRNDCGDYEQFGVTMSGQKIEPECTGEVYAAAIAPNLDWLCETTDSALTACSGVQAGDTLVATGHAGAHSWGDWQAWASCPDGEFAVAMQQRVEGNQGSGDDTGLNAVRMRCSDGTEITSHGGHWGGWSAWSSCSACTDKMPNGELWHDSDGDTYDCAWYGEGSNCATYGNGYANKGLTANDACCACGGGGPVAFDGFAIKNEPNQGGGDDTGANAVQMYCGSAPSEPSTNAGWGGWSNHVSCPAGKGICGFRIRIEGQGGDDTAMNDIEMKCCDAPDSMLGQRATSPCTEKPESGIPDGECCNLLLDSDPYSCELCKNYHSGALSGPANNCGVGQAKCETLSLHDGVLCDGAEPPCRFCQSAGVSRTGTAL